MLNVEANTQNARIARGTARQATAGKQKAGGQFMHETQQVLAASTKQPRAKGPAKPVSATRAATKKAGARTITKPTGVSPRPTQKASAINAAAPGPVARSPSNSADLVTKASRAGTTSGKVKPRAISSAKPIGQARAAPHSVPHVGIDAHTPDEHAPHSDGQQAHETHLTLAVAYSTYPLPAEQRGTVMQIHLNWRRRQALVKAMTKLSLQAQAVLRGNKEREAAAKHYAVVAKDPSHEDHLIIVPYLESMAVLERYRGAHEKELVRLAKALPIYQWAKGVSGLGDLSLAGLVGEASGQVFDDGKNDTGEFWTIGQMKSVSAFWKRMGLAVLGGVRQGDSTAGLSKAEWVEHGYVKTRRSVAWNIGECIVKAQWRKENTTQPYGKFYGEEKARLQALNDEGAFAETAARIVERMKKAGGKPLAENLAGRLTPAHINNRAKRHMMKRLLRDLFVEWRRLDAEARLCAPTAQAA